MQPDTAPVLGPTRPKAGRRSFLLRFVGPLLTLAIAVLLEALSRTALSIPNPVFVLILVVVAAAFSGGIRSALASAMVAWLYSAYYFSIPGHPFVFATDNLRRVVVLAIAFPGTALMVGILKERTRLLGRERAARAAAEAAQQRIASVLESITDAFFALDRQWRFTYVNQQAERLLQRPRGELLGKSVWDVFPGPLGMTFASQYQRAVETQQTVQFETFSPPLDAWFEIRVYPAPDGLSVYFQDITARKRAERQLAAQYAVTRVLAEAATLEEAAPQMLRAVCESLGWEWGALWQVDERGEALRCLETWSTTSTATAAFQALSRQTRLPRGVGLPGRVWAQAAPAWIPDVSQDDNFPRRPAAIQAGLHAALAFPVVSGGEVLGIIEFLSREIRQPDEPLLGMLAAVGGQIGQFIERHRAAEALRESEARLRAIWEVVADAMALSDPEGIVLAANQAYFQLFGYSSEQVIGHSFALIFPLEERESAVQQYRAVFSSQDAPQAFEAWVQRADGARRRVEARVTFISQQGVRTAMISSIRDITERTRAEEERAELLRRAQAAREEAEAAVAARDAFLAAVSHDLRNPLTTIKGYADMLLRQVTRESTVEVDALANGLTRISETTRRMTALIEELLDATRLRAGQPLELRLQTTDLVALVRRAATEAQQTTANHELRVTADEMVLIGLWDPLRLERVVANLLSNAIKYSPAGGPIELTLARQPDGRGDWAVLRVRDQGIGIPADELPRLFEPFYRGRNVIGLIAGTGIGLAGARQIVEQLGGQITVESREGVGSTFTVRLPLESHPASPSPQPPA